MNVRCERQGTYITVTLSRRNLEALVHMLREADAGHISMRDVCLTRRCQGRALEVSVEEDAVHYAGRAGRSQKHGAS